MAHIGNDRKRLRTGILTSIVMLWMATIHAQQLSPNTMGYLAACVQQQYAMTMMEGATAYKTSDGTILVVTVAVKRSSTMQRVAQVKATRTAGEYLQGAMNKSVTVYESTQESGYTLSDNAIESSISKNAEIASNLQQSVEDQSLMKTEERFSDKIIQSTLTRVNYMQPLTRFTGEDGYQVFAYFLFLK